MKVVGFYDYTDFRGSEAEPIIVSDNIFNNYYEIANGEVSFVVTKLSNSYKQVIILINNGYKTNEGVMYPIYNEISLAIDYVDDILIYAKEILIYISLVLAIFSSLLLYNFISLSISNSIKSIGILTSLGIRKKNIFIIFFSESLIISLMNFIFSILSIFISINYINNQITKIMYLKINIFIFSFNQIIFLLGIFVIISFLSTLLPILNLFRKKPIELIKEL